MLLCDVGNTSYHFFDGEHDNREDVKLFNPASIKKHIYYVCVNHSLSKKLEILENWIDISVMVDKTKYYETMGIDRIIACESIENGVIIDVGSAITVDVINDGSYEGGFIYPGITSMNKAYKSISTALNYPFNFELDINKLPKNSQDSISYGYLKPFYEEIISFNMPIYLTGGDGYKFMKMFTNATFDNRLIFKAMKNICKKMANN